MRVLAALFGGWIAAAALGQGTVPAPGKVDPESMPTLWQGDAAPGLHVGKWVKGGPVGEFEKGKVYVVEFWATWCVPCVKSMPHLSEVQAKYKDRGVVVVGVTRQDPHNSLEVVEAMVKEKGETLAYAVAWDEGERTYDDYMQATRQGGIPCAFVVNGEGKLAWIGHPANVEAAIEGVLSGRLDMKVEADAARAYHAKRIAALKAWHEYERAKKAQEWSAAVAACLKLEEAGDPNYGFVWGEEFEALLLRLKDYERASVRGREMMAGPLKDDAAGLSRISWTITAFEGVEKRDLELAEDLALRSVEVGPGNPFAWRAKGAVEFRRGEKEKAIRLMERGMKLASEDWSKGELEQALRWVRGEAGSPLTGK